MFLQRCVWGIPFSVIRRCITGRLEFRVLEEWFCLQKLRIELQSDTASYPERRIFKTELQSDAASYPEKTKFRTELQSDAASYPERTKFRTELQNGTASNPERTKFRTELHSDAAVVSRKNEIQD